MEFSIQKQRAWIERASLRNILASTAKGSQEKTDIVEMFRNAPERTKSEWNMRFEDSDVLFDKRWAMVLATKRRA